MDENGTIVPAEVKGWNWGALCTTFSGVLETKLTYLCCA